MAAVFLLRIYASEKKANTFVDKIVYEVNLR